MPSVTRQTPKTTPTPTLPSNQQRLQTGGRTKGGTVLDRIASIGFADNEGIKVLLYGKSGTGKTTLSATFPRPILWVVCSGSSRPGELRSINTPENRKTIQQVILEKAEELQTITEFQKSQLKFNTLVLDHVTGLQDLVLKEVLGVEELPVQKSWGMATQQQYGTTAQRSKELMRGLLSLDCNVVVIAQEREYNTDGTGEVLQPFVGAALMPSLLGWLNPAVDYICQTFIKQKEETKKMTLGTGKDAKTVETKQKIKGVDFCLRTAPDPVYITKFRVPRKDLPEYLVDPTYDKLKALIDGQ